MAPLWARRRTAQEQHELEIDEIAAKVREWRGVGPEERGRRLTALAAEAIASARHSPFWQRACEAEPKPPAAEARWQRLVQAYRTSSGIGP